MPLGFGFSWFQSLSSYHCIVLVGFVLHSPKTLSLLLVSDIWDLGNKAFYKIKEG